MLMQWHNQKPDQDAPAGFGRAGVNKVSVVQAGRSGPKSKTLRSVAAGLFVIVGAGGYLLHYKTALSPFATPPSCNQSKVKGNLKKMYVRALSRLRVKRRDIAVKNAGDVAFEGEGRRCQAEVVIRGRHRFRSIYSIRWIDRVSRRYELRIISSKRWAAQAL